MELFVLTYFPNTEHEMRLGVYSSVEKVAERIKDNQTVKEEYKLSKEQIANGLAPEIGMKFGNTVFLIERLYLDF